MYISAFRGAVWDLVSANIQFGFSSIVFYGFNSIVAVCNKKDVRHTPSSARKSRNSMMIHSMQQILKSVRFYHNAVGTGAIFCEICGSRFPACIVRRGLARYCPKTMNHAGLQDCHHMVVPSRGAYKSGNPNFLSRTASCNSSLSVHSASLWV